MAYSSEKRTKMAIICTKTTVNYDEYQKELQKIPTSLRLVHLNFVHFRLLIRNTFHQVTVHVSLKYLSEFKVTIYNDFIAVLHKNDLPCECSK